jgi:hypothetical protein
VKFSRHPLLAGLVCAAALDASVPARAAIFFGDLHGHSGLSNDATGSADNFFTVARDVARLDFVVLSDHDIFLIPAEVEVLTTMAASFNQEGTFVAFSGVEWTHAWHMNAYFRDDDEPYCLGKIGGVSCGHPDGFLAALGGGARKTDCLVEWTMPPRARARGKRVPNHITCTDGDPACDVGTEANECVVRAGLCLAVSDSRLRRCTPELPSAVDVLSPPAAARGSVEVENRTTLLAALQALGTLATPGACTPLFELRVPVGTSVRGRPATGSRPLELVAHASTGDDTDRFELRCRPARR